MASYTRVHRIVSPQPFQLHTPISGHIYRVTSALHHDPWFTPRCVSFGRRSAPSRALHTHTIQSSLSCWARIAAHRWRGWFFTAGTLHAATTIFNFAWTTCNARCLLLVGHITGNGALVTGTTVSDFSSDASHARRVGSVGHSARAAGITLAIHTCPTCGTEVAERWAVRSLAIPTLAADLVGIGRRSHPPTKTCFAPGATVIWLFSSWTHNTAYAVRSVVATTTHCALAASTSTTRRGYLFSRCTLHTHQSVGTILTDAQFAAGLVGEELIPKRTPQALHAVRAVLHRRTALAGCPQRSRALPRLAAQVAQPVNARPTRHARGARGVCCVWRCAVLAGRAFAVKP